MIVLGIDNGKRGAIASIDGKCALVDPTPLIGSKLDYARMAGLVIYHAGLNPTGAHAFIESAQAFPQNAGRAVATYCTGHGVWLGLLVAKAIPYTIVHPTRWKNVMLAGMDKSDKASSIRRAKELFPTVDLVPPGCRKANDGMAEALLIAEYGRRTLVSQVNQAKTP